MSAADWDALPDWDQVVERMQRAEAERARLQNLCSMTLALMLEGRDRGGLFHRGPEWWAEFDQVIETLSMHEATRGAGNGTLKLHRLE